MNYLSLFSIIFLFNLIGCGPGQDSGRPSKADIQSIREQTILEFFNDPEKAKIKYKENVLSNRKKIDRGEVAKRLAASGQLMIFDSENKASYMQYVKSHLDSPDHEIQSIAVAALANAVSEESLEILLEKINSKSEIVRIEASGALKSRYVDAVSGPAQRENLDFLRINLKKICKDEVDKSVSVRDLCNHVAGLAKP